MTSLIFEKKVKKYLFQIYNEKPDFDLIQVEQVHGPLVLEDIVNKNEPCQADGLFSINLDLPLAIKTADCLPIFILGKKGVSLLHAGWKGVHQKIVLADEVKSLAPYYFFIGPFIQAKHFEVQIDFRLNFPQSKHFLENEGKLNFDLGAELKDQIKSSYKKADVELSEISTFNDPAFHSYRRNGTIKRNWNILSKIK